MFESDLETISVLKEEYSKRTFKNRMVEKKNIDSSKEMVSAVCLHVLKKSTRARDAL